jgi:hypothetical protein
VVDNVFDHFSDCVQSRLQGLGVFSGSAKVDDMVAKVVSTLRPVMTATWVPWMSILFPDVAEEFATQDHNACLVTEAEARCVTKDEVWANAYLSGKVNLEALAVGYGLGGSEEDIGREVLINSCRALEEMEVELEVEEPHVEDRKGKAKAVATDEGPHDPLHLPKGSFVVSFVFCCLSFQLTLLYLG